MAYAPLERAVMAALAHELRNEVPDLARQFIHSRPGQRRNSGLGLYTEMIPDRGRPRPGRSAGAVTLGPSGNLGTVHAMVGSLRDPIAFQVRLSNGSLLGLFGDSYGQDTRGVDFATTPFDQVFMLDAQGQSVAFEPAPATPADASAWRSPAPAPPPRAEPPHSTPAPARTAPAASQSAARTDARVAAKSAAHAAPKPAAKPAATPGQSLDALLSTGEPAAVREVLNAVFGAPTGEPAEPVSREDTISLVIGVWVTVAALAVIAMVVFDIEPFVGLIGWIAISSSLQRPKGLAAIRRGLEAWRRSRPNASG